MSKWTPKDPTEARPLSRMPMPVRVLGVPPGSDIAQAVLDEHQGEINHFYLSQAQHVAAGNLSQWRKYGGTPDLQLEYTNNRGQELLKIRPSASLVSKLEGKLSEERPWTVAVVDIISKPDKYTYHDGSTAYPDLSVYAQQVTPPASGTNGLAGVHTSDMVEYSTETVPVLQWAHAPTRPQIGGDGSTNALTQIYSLLIDVRNYRRLNVVAFDLYAALGGLGTDEYVHPGALLGYFTFTFPTTDTIVDTVTLAVGVDPDYSREGEISDTTPPDWRADSNLAKDVTFQTIQPVPGEIYDNGIWYYYAGDEFSGAIVTRQWVSTLIDIHTRRWDLHEYVEAYNFWYRYDVVTDVVPAVPTGKADFAGVMFRNMLDFRWEQRTGAVTGLDTYRWFVGPQYPVRFGMPAVADIATLSPSDNAKVDTHGLTKIGQIQVHPKRGTVTFTPV